MALEKVEASSYTFNWGAVFAGAVVAVGCWLFLYALGAAIGGPVREGPPTWTATYIVVAPILAFFAGGLITSRSRGITSRSEGALHGLVVWGCAVLLGTALLALLGSLVPTTAMQRLDVPTGYNWAVAGSLFGSAVAAVLGATMGLGKRTELPRREPLAPREAHP